MSCYAAGSTATAHFLLASSIQRDSRGEGPTTAQTGRNRGHNPWARECRSAATRPGAIVVERSAAGLLPLSKSWDEGTEAPWGL